MSSRSRSLIRLSAYGRRPQDFFRNGWNVFDFVVVGAAYVPFVRESVTLLRLARLLRIARLLSVIPGLRIVVLGIARSLAPIGGMAALTFFVLYLYGMLGWLLFADHDPERFGNIGRSLLTLFQILTLEGWNDVLAKEMELSSWAWVYFVSFVLIGTFVVLNVVIAIIVNSMDEVRAMELERERKELVAAALTDGGDRTARLHERLEALRQALDDLDTLDRRRSRPARRRLSRRRARRPRARGRARERPLARRRQRACGPPTSSSTGSVSTRPTTPTIIRIRPDHVEVHALHVPVTAYLRIAPTAIRKIDVPMPTGGPPVSMQSPDLPGRSSATLYPGAPARQTGRAPGAAQSGHLQSSPSRPPSSNGQDAALSRLKSEFDSPWRHYPHRQAESALSEGLGGNAGGNTPRARRSM